MHTTGRSNFYAKRAFQKQRNDFALFSSGQRQPQREKKSAGDFLLFPQLQQTAKTTHGHRFFPKRRNKKIACTGVKNAFSGGTGGAKSFIPR